MKDPIERQDAIDALQAMVVPRYKDPECEDMWERDRTLYHAIVEMRKLPSAKQKVSKFIEFKKREYFGEHYISSDICVSINHISRVVQCEETDECVNIVTIDGKIHTISERYSDVITKIRHAEGCEENGNN